MACEEGHVQKINYMISEKEKLLNLSIVTTFSHHIQILSSCQNHPCSIHKEAGNTILEAITLLPVLGIIILGETLLQNAKHQVFRI